MVAAGGQAVPQQQGVCLQPDQGHRPAPGRPCVARFIPFDDDKLIIVLFFIYVLLSCHVFECIFIKIPGIKNYVPTF